MVTTGTQQPVREDVAPFGVRTKLNFIHGQKIRPPGQGHRLDRADEIVGPVGNDFFFARDQGNSANAFLGDHAIINFPRQQTQGQANDTSAMPQHAFHGQVGLAGIRRSQNSRYTTAIMMSPMCAHTAS